MENVWFWDLDIVPLKNNWKVSNLRKIQCWIKWAVEICSIKFIVSLKSLQCDYFLCLQWWKRIFRPLDFYFFLDWGSRFVYLLSFILFSFSCCTLFFFLPTFLLPWSSSFLHLQDHNHEPRHRMQLSMENSFSLVTFFLSGPTSDSYKHKSNGFKHQNISNFIKRKRRSETLLVVADDREVEMRKRSYCFAQTKLDLANQLRQLISKSIIIYKEVLRIFHHVILIYHFHYLCYIINWEYKSVIIGVFLYLNVFEYI